MRTISFQMQGSIVLTPTLAHEKDLLAYAAAWEFQESYYTGIEVLLLDSENQGPGVSKSASRKWIFRGDEEERAHPLAKLSLL